MFYAKRSQLQPPVYNINEQFSPNVHLPWSCSFETFWKDLGEAYFPRLNDISIHLVAISLDVL
jgi:hypothetical protein